MQPQSPNKLVISVPAQLNEPQALSPARKSPAYLQGKDPYGQLLDRIEHPYREPRITTVVYRTPSQTGASIDGRVRTSGQLQFKTRPTPSAPSESTESSPVLDIQPPPLLSLQARKSLSVQSIRSFFESKISQYRSAPSLPTEVFPAAEVTPANYQPEDQVGSTPPSSDETTETIEEEEADNTSPPPMLVEEQETDESSPPAIVKEATIYYNLPDYDDKQSDSDIKGAVIQPTDAFFDAAGDDAPVASERAAENSRSRLDQGLASPARAVKSTELLDQGQTFEYSVSEYYIFRSMSFAETKGIIAPKEHEPKTKCLRSRPCREIRSSFEKVKQSSPRQSWQSISSIVPLTVDMSFYDVGEPTDSVVAEYLFMDIDRGLSHDGPSSNPKSAPMDTSFKAAATANVGVQNGYNVVKVPDHVDWRGAYGRRQTLDFGYPGARLKPRKTYRSFKPLPNPDHWVKRACGHFSYLENGEVREHAGQKICRQCSSQGYPPTQPSPPRRRTEGKAVARPSAPILPTSTESQIPKRRSSERTPRRPKSLSADNCGDFFATDLESAINSILEEHANTLQDVINNIKQSQPSIQELQRVSKDLVQRSETSGVPTGIVKIPCRPPYSRQRVCQEASHQPVCSPQVSEIQPCDTYMSPKAAEKLNVGSPGKLKPSINDSRSSLQESVQTIPELLDLVDSTADDLGINLGNGPDVEDNKTFRDAPLEGGPSYLTPRSKRTSLVTIDEPIDDNGEPSDDPWLQQTRRHFDDISEARSNLMDELDSIAEDLGIQIQSRHPSNAQACSLSRAPTETPARRSQSLKPLPNDYLSSINEEIPNMSDRRVSARQISRTVISNPSQSRQESTASAVWKDLGKIKPGEVPDWLAVARVELPIARHSIDTVLAALPPPGSETSDDADRNDAFEPCEYPNDQPFASFSRGQSGDDSSEHASSIITRKPTDRMSIPRSTIERVLSYQSEAGAPSPEELIEGTPTREEIGSRPLLPTSSELLTGEDLQPPPEPPIEIASSRVQSFALNMQQQRGARAPSLPSVKQRVTQLDQLNSPKSRQPTFTRWRAPSKGPDQFNSLTRATIVDQDIPMASRRHTRQPTTLSATSSEDTLKEATEPLMKSATGLPVTSRQATNQSSDPSSGRLSENVLLESIDRSTDGQGDEARPDSDQQSTQQSDEASKNSVKTSTKKTELPRTCESRRGTQAIFAPQECPAKVQDEAADLDNQEPIRSPSKSDKSEHEQQLLELSPVASRLESPRSLSSAATSSMKVNRWFTAMEEITPPSDEDTTGDITDVATKSTPQSTKVLSPLAPGAREVANDESPFVYSEAGSEREPKREIQPTSPAATARVMTGLVMPSSEPQELAPIEEISDRETTGSIKRISPVSHTEDDHQLNDSQPEDKINSTSGSASDSVTAPSRRASQVSKSSPDQRLSKSPPRKSSSFKQPVETEDALGTAVSRKTTELAREGAPSVTAASQGSRSPERPRSQDSDHPIKGQVEEPRSEGEDPMLQSVQERQPPTASPEKTVDQEPPAQVSVAGKDDSADMVGEQHVSAHDLASPSGPIEKTLLDQPLAALDIYNASPASLSAVFSNSSPVATQPSSRERSDSDKLDDFNLQQAADEPILQDLPAEQLSNIDDTTPEPPAEPISEPDHNEAPRAPSPDATHIASSTTPHSEETAAAEGLDDIEPKKVRLATLPKRLSIFPPASSPGSRKPSTATPSPRKTNTTSPSIVTAPTRATAPTVSSIGKQNTKPNPEPTPTPEASKTQRLCRCPSSRKSRSGTLSAASTPEPSVRVRPRTVAADVDRTSKGKGKQRADTASEPIAASASPSSARPSAAKASPSANVGVTDFANPSVEAEPDRETASVSASTSTAKGKGKAKAGEKRAPVQRPRARQQRLARRYDYPSPLVPVYARKDDYYARLGPIVREEERE